MSADGMSDAAAAFEALLRTPYLGPLPSEQELHATVRRYAEQQGQSTEQTVTAAVGRRQSAGGSRTVIDDEDRLQRPRNRLKPVTEVPCGLDADVPHRCDVQP